jgi:hypothetical protein
LRETLGGRGLVTLPRIDALVVDERRHLRRQVLSRKVEKQRERFWCSGVAMS